MNERAPLWKKGMTVSVQTERGLLRATLSGEFEPADAERTFVEVLDAVASRKIDKVLIDGRGLSGEPDVIHRFLYGEFAALTAERYVLARRIPRAAQLAYVLLQPVLDPLRFGESVALHWGMWVKAFDDLGEAQAWLAAEPAGDPQPSRA
jgi:hypothetical protein